MTFTPLCAQASISSIGSPPRRSSGATTISWMPSVSVDCNKPRPGSSSSLSGTTTAWPGTGMKPTMLNDWRSEENTSELQSLMRISYAVFCLTKNNTTSIDRGTELLEQYQEHK